MSLKCADADPFPWLVGRFVLFENVRGTFKVPVSVAISWITVSELSVNRRGAGGEDKRDWFLNCLKAGCK